MNSCLAWLALDTQAKSTVQYLPQATYLYHYKQATCSHRSGLTFRAVGSAKPVCQDCGVLSATVQP